MECTQANHRTNLGNSRILTGHWSTPKLILEPWLTKRRTTSTSYEPGIFVRWLPTVLIPTRVQRLAANLAMRSGYGDGGQSPSSLQVISN